MEQTIVHRPTGLDRACIGRTEDHSQTTFAQEIGALLLAAGFAPAKNPLPGMGIANPVPCLHRENVHVALVADPRSPGEIAVSVGIGLMGKPTGSFQLMQGTISFLQASPPMTLRLEDDAQGAVAYVERLSVEAAELAASGHYRRVLPQ